MGKAARNEIKKIEATFLNNIAISFFVAGFTVPYLTLIQNLDVFNEFGSIKSLLTQIRSKAC